jgi:phenylacetate-CoA ligase
MAPFKQKLYWKSPYFVKCWLASFNARKLDSERHGPIFQQVLDEIAQRDKWSTEQFFEYQRKQLCSLIQHAAAKVPYYRKMFSETGIDPKSITGPDALQRLPILEKETIRADPKSLVDETLDIKKLLIAHTSGTTGTPIDLYRDVWLNSVAFAYMEARFRVVAGMCRRVNKSVTSFGHLVTAPKRNRPPFWVYNRRWKQLYISSYHLSPKYLGYYVNELQKFKADYIECMPSTLYTIARYILDNELEPVPFKACFTTAETLFDYQREAIKKAFGCRTYDQYGCGELVVFAAECSAGSMHQSPEMGIVEVVDDNDKPAAVGQSGQLICTSLINRIQPFIRYRVGDVGALKAGQCSCGSPLPMLGRIEGRADDVLITRDGRRIGRLDPVFKGTRGIVEAQIVQEDYGRFRVRVVPSNVYKEEDGRGIRDSLLARVGQGTVEIELVDRIERTSAGKFKAVVRNIPREGGD